MHLLAVFNLPSRQASDCAEGSRLFVLPLQIFESIGTVRELVVLRDRETQESKCSAFVWYATGEDADKVGRASNGANMLG
jgi:hypothetical protein